MTSSDSKDNQMSLKEEVKDKAESPATPKLHTITVCMVPPTDATRVWEKMTRARTELKDPGLYRWPPHANLLYPFFSLRTRKDKGENDDDMVLDTNLIQKLRNATQHCEPFNVTLDTFGTFGGKQRGVLWLYPSSSRENSQRQQQQESEGATAINAEKQRDEPLIQLQSLLEREFPHCSDQRKQGGRFHPHMTLSHFPSLEAAQEAQKQVESWWSSESFICREIYVLERKGDDGQFVRLVTLRLGSSSSDGFQIHTVPLAFESMPTVEEDWVREERMKLKERRNTSWNRRGRGSRRRRRKAFRGDDSSARGPSRSTDTPEEIEAKRAARKATRGKPSEKG